MNGNPEIEEIRFSNNVKFELLLLDRGNQESRKRVELLCATKLIKSMLHVGSCTSPGL